MQHTKRTAERYTRLIKIENTVVGDDGGAPVGGQHGRSPDSKTERHATQYTYSWVKSIVLLPVLVLVLVLIVVLVLVLIVVTVILVIVITSRAFP